MTVRGKLESMLVNMGMFPSQAIEVVDLSIPKINELSEDYNISWYDSEDAYPEVMYNVLFASVKVDALSWIVNNKPQAWFRPMFEYQH